MRRRVVTPGGVAVQAIDDPKGDGIPLVNMDDDRVVRDDRDPDDQGPLGQQVARDPNRADVPPHRAGAAPPRRVPVVGVEDARPVLVVEQEVRDQDVPGG